MKRLALQSLAAAALLGAAVAANAGIVRINEGAFTAQAGKITFSEQPTGTNNPVYAPADYGGGVDAPTVSFGGFFSGQSLSATPGADCPLGAASGCVVGTPSAGLSLDPNSPKTIISSDGSNPTSPVLSGSPLFNGPIAILFSVDLAGVGLDGGFFNAIGGTAITAFDRNGNTLGQVKNASCGNDYGDPPPCTAGGGIEFLGLVTDDGSEKIAGLLFSLVGAEPAGFAIDNVRFGRAGEVVNPNPEPASLALVGLALAGLGLARRRRA